MKSISVQLTRNVEEESLCGIVELLREIVVDAVPYCPPLTEEERKQLGRLRSSYIAGLAGEKPPEGMGLLIDNKQLSRLLCVAERTIWGLQQSGQMPPPIRIGRLVRWSYDSIKQWIAAGCPAQRSSRIT